MMKFKVLIEDTEEIPNIAYLLFHRTKEEILNEPKGSFSDTFNSLEDALLFIKEFFDDIDEDYYKDCWTSFIVIIKENKIIGIDQYNHALVLKSEVY